MYVIIVSICRELKVTCLALVNWMARFEDRSPSGKSLNWLGTVTTDDEDGDGGGKGEGDGDEEGAEEDGMAAGRGHEEVGRCSRIRRHRDTMRAREEDS